jgi:TonB family protein
MKRAFWIVLLLGICVYSGFGYGQINITELEREIVELESEIDLLETRVSQLERNYENVSNILSRMNTTPDPMSSPPAEVLDLGSLDSSLTSPQEGREGIGILWDDPSQGREPTYTPRPQIPAWVSEQGLSLQVVVSFELAPQGVLRDVKVEQSSGYSDVDAAVLEALRRWKFRPVSSSRTVTGRIPYTIIPRGGLAATRQAAPTGKPWKDKQNWRRLELGMSTDAVARILGDPERINKDPNAELWRYPGGGSVVFWNERLHHWSEP